MWHGIDVAYRIRGISNYMQTMAGPIIALLIISYFIVWLYPVLIPLLYSY